MADDIQDPVGTGSPADVSAGGGAPAISDPRDSELAQLREYYSQVAPIIDRLRPYDEDIKAIVEDEGYRDFQRTSRKSYYQMLDEQKKAEADALSPGEKRLLAEIDSRLKPAIEEVDVLRKDRESRTAREATEAKAASTDFAKRETEYASRLVADGKLSSEEVADLGRFAMTLHQESVTAGNPRFVGIEEVYKRVYGRAEAKAAAPVAKSLRAKSAAPGVPGASRPDPGARADMSKPGGFTNHMLATLNNQRKTG